MIAKISTLIGLSVLFSLALCGQDSAVRSDTVALDLGDAERQFLAANLQLLAARFNIDAARAAETQAGLWSNPNISIEQNVYNQETGKYFDFTKTGNTEVQLQQLFLLAGKRDKQISLARINTDISENTFNDLLRSLRLELRTDFFDLYFLHRSVRFYDTSVASLRKTVAATEAMYDKRAILLSEALRLKSLLFSLQTERLEVVNRITEIENELRLLLRDERRVVYEPRLDPKLVEAMSIMPLSFDAALEAAREHRPDLKNAEAQIAYEEANLALQKALAIPDVTLGGRWSRAGSYIPDYFAVTVSVDLPLFNRNQGNIAVSENSLEADKASRANAILSVRKDLEVAYQKARATDSLYRAFDRQFAVEYAQLVDGTIANYQKRNISIIEFTDFYESYRTSMLEMFKLQNDRIDAFVYLDFVAGTDIIPFHTAPDSSR